jgi:hypothetical protein
MLLPLYYPITFKIRQYRGLTLLTTMIQVFLRVCEVVVNSYPAFVVTSNDVVLVTGKYPAADAFASTLNVPGLECPPIVHGSEYVPEVSVILPCKTFLKPDV